MEINAVNVNKLDSVRCPVRGESCWLCGLVQRL